MKGLIITVAIIMVCVSCFFALSISSETGDRNLYAPPSLQKLLYAMDNGIPVSFDKTISRFQKMSSFFADVAEKESNLANGLFQRGDNTDIITVLKDIYTLFYILVDTFIQTWGVVWHLIVLSLTVLLDALESIIWLLVFFARILTPQKLL